MFSSSSSVRVCLLVATCCLVINRAVAFVPLAAGRCPSTARVQRAASAVHQTHTRATHVSMQARPETRRTAHAGRFPPIAVQPQQQQQQAGPTKRSRVARWTGHLKTAVKRILLGYDPAEEVEAEEYATAMTDFAARGQAIVEARDAALAEELGLPRSDPEEEFLFSDREEVVELDVISAKSPLEEDIMASLRKRMQQMKLEQETPADVNTEQLVEQPVSRGSSAVATRGSSVLDDDSADVFSAPAESAAPVAVEREVEEVKMASAADVERLRRMFGSV